MACNQLVFRSTQFHSETVSNSDNTVELKTARTRQYYLANNANLAKKKKRLQQYRSKFHIAELNVQIGADRSLGDAGHNHCQYCHVNSTCQTGALVATWRRMGHKRLDKCCGVKNAMHDSRVVSTLLNACFMV